MASSRAASAGSALNMGDVAAPDMEVCPGEVLGDLTDAQLKVKVGDKWWERYYSVLQPHETIEDADRWKGVDGSRRWRECLRLYAYSERRTLPYYIEGKPNERALFRNRHNARKSDNTVKKYAQGVLEFGCNWLGRGAAIAVQEDDGKFSLLAGGTLVEAVYLGKETQPNNEYIQEAMQTGVPGAVVFRKITPPDGCEWIKNNHNFYNTIAGCATTWLELLEKIDDAESSWREKCRKEGISTDSCPKSGPFRYEKMYEAHIMKKFKGYFNGWDHYQACKGTHNKAKAMGIYSEWKEWAERKANFLDQSCKPHIMAEVQNFCLVVVEHFSDNGLAPEWLLKEVALMLLKFSTPLVEDCSDADWANYGGVINPGVFARAKRQLSVLRCPIGKSAAYVKGMEANAAAAAKRKREEEKQHAEKKGEEPDAKKVKGTGRGRATKPQKKDPKKVEEEFKGTITVAGVDREMLWLDDLFQAALAPLRPLRESQINKPQVIIIVLDGVKFALLSTITLSGKEL
ncbi:unnamed protein product, partial [Prorocentrum cordatum]